MQNFTYLNFGTGYACAGQRRVTPLPEIESKVKLFKIVANLGALLPTGSKIN